MTQSHDEVGGGPAPALLGSSAEAAVVAAAPSVTAAPSVAERTLGAAEAHVAVWLGVGLLDALAIAFTPGASLARLGLHAFDLGHVLAMALGGGLVLRVLPARVRGSLRLSLAALGLFAVAVALGTLVPDFRNFAERHDRPELRFVLGGLAGLAIPAAALGGSLASRFRARWVAVALSAAVVVGNHYVLQADYPGVHLFAAWSAATFATAALAGAKPPERAADRIGALQRSLGGRLALGVVGALGLASLLIWPPPSVLVEAFQSEGSVLFPFLAKLHGDEEAGLGRGGPGPGVAAAWMVRRDAGVSIPPSEPVLAPKRPLVILITIDAMRANLLLEPKWRKRLPNLSLLSDDAAHFTLARSPGSTTRNGLGQIFASKYSAQLHWTYEKGIGRNLRKDPTPRLTGLLKDAGFTTVYLSTYAGLSGKGMVLGKFDHETRLKAERDGQRFPLSDEVVEAALRALDDHKERPLFLYMHWLDAHDPYDLNGTEGGIFESYLREIEHCDRSIGYLVHELRARKLYDKTILALAADHGEALGDHGIPHHGGGLYESLVRVPLLIRVPGVPGRKVDAPVTSLDLTPTLLDVLGLPIPGEYMGQSLVGFLRGEPPELDRPIGFDQSGMIGLVLGNYKVIDNRRRKVVEIYDLREDPKEKHNLYGKLEDGRDQRLLAQLREFFSIHARGKGGDSPED